MAQKVVQVTGYMRKRRKVSGYERLQDIDRGPIGKKRTYPRIQKTIYLQDRLGKFKGRKRTLPYERHDTTGIIRELSAGRIVGRSKSFKT